MAPADAHGPRLSRRRFLVVAAGAGLLSAARAGHAAERFESGLLWQITRPGGQPNWLFGTLHRQDVRLLPLPIPVDAVFRRCRRLVIELFPDEAVAARFSEAARLPAEESLDRLLPAAAFAELATKLAAQGMTPAATSRLKPWAALLVLTALPADGNGNSLDNELFIRARYANMRIEELDSVEEQIAVFDDIPLASQLALLEAALDFHHLLPIIASRTIDAYLARDLARLHRLGQALAADRPALAEHQRRLEKKVVVDRSVVMAYRLQPYLRLGATFAAVGASHLHGDHGLPQLLRREYGWRVHRHW